MTQEGYMREPLTEYERGRLDGYEEGFEAGRERGFDDGFEAGWDGCVQDALEEAELSEEYREHGEQIERYEEAPYPEDDTDAPGEYDAEYDERFFDDEDQEEY